MASVAILGGGVSGLATAHYLAKASSTSLCRKILVLESSSKLGGWVQTSREEDGTVFEQGPRSLRSSGHSASNTVQLVEELGLGEDIVSVKAWDPAAKNRFIYVNKQLHKLPNNIGGLMRSQPPFSKSLFRMGWKEPFLPRGTEKDETIHSFVSRRLGTEVADYLISAVCRGIFAGDAKQLSMKSCFPPLWQMEKEHGSLIRGTLFRKVPPPVESQLIQRFKKEKIVLWSFKNGLQQLTQGLSEQLKTDNRVEILKETPCTRLQFEGEKVKVSSGDKVFEADHLVSTCLASKLAELVADDQSVFSDLLTTIPTVTVAVVNLQFEGNLLHSQGFGHLIPSCEPSDVMGVIYDSSVFPDHNRRGSPNTRFTCMMGGAWFQELFGDEGREEVFHDLAVKAVRDQLKITQDPFRVRVKVQRDCIPQYLVGHSEKLDRIHGYIDSHKLPLSLAGSSYYGVSLNDCILSGRAAAENLVASWKKM